MANIRLPANQVDADDSDLSDDDVVAIWAVSLIDGDPGEGTIDVSKGMVITEFGKRMKGVDSVKDQRSGSLQFWSGTQAQYDAIATKDDDTIYFVLP